MRVTSLFIEPNSLSALTEKPERSRNEQLDPVGESEAKTFWASLEGTETKHAWIKDVKDCIGRLIGNYISISAKLHLEQVMEDFVNTKLLPNVDVAEEDYKQGIQLLSSWTGLTSEAIEEDTALVDLAQELQECYDRNKENQGTPEELYRGITCLIMVRFLEKVAEKVRDTTPADPVITLFYCLYVEHTDSTFSYLKQGYVEKDLIPLQPSMLGVTLNCLRLGFADFFKQYYERAPMLENGVLNLLAGASNVIRLTEAEITLAKNILGKAFEGSQKILFFTLHRFLLYLTFTNVEARLADSSNKVWTVAIVLDSLNEAVRMYKWYAAHS